MLPQSLEKQRRGVQSRQQLGIAGSPSSTTGNKSRQVTTPTINDRVDVDERPLRTLHKFRTAAAWTSRALSNPEDDTELLRQRNVVLHATSKAAVEANNGIAAAQLKLRATTPLLSFDDSKFGRPKSRAASTEPWSSGNDMMLPKPGFHSLFVPRSLPVGPLDAPAALGNAHDAAQQRLQYFQWAQSFDAERGNFTSPTVWAELVMCQVVNATKGRPVPDPLRTAACALVLDRLVAHRDECGIPVVMGVIKTELLNAVYANHHVDLSRVVDVRAGDNEGPPRASTPVPTKSGAPAFIDMPMHASRATKLERKVEELRRGSLSAVGRLSAIGSDAAAGIELRRLAEIRGRLGASERLIKRAFFSAWRHVAIRNRQVTDAAAAWVRIATRSNTHFLVAETFRKWRRFLAGRRDVEAQLRREVAELKAQLVSRDEEIEELRRAHVTLKKASSLSANSVATSRTPRPHSPSSRTPRGGLTPRDGSGTVQHLGAAQSPGSSQQLLLATAGSSPQLLGAQRGGGKVTSGDDAPLAKVEKVTATVFLEWWVREMISCSPFRGVVKLTSIDGGLCDGRVYTALTCILHPECGADVLFQIDDTAKRIDRLMTFLDGIGVPRELITAAEIANASLSNIGLLAWFYLRWYESQREAINNLEISSDFSSAPFVISRGLGLTRMVPDGFRILAEKVVFQTLISFVQRIRQQNSESNSALADMAEFTTVKDFYFGEFEDRLDTEMEVSLMVPMLRAHYTDLKKIFDFYRGLSAPPSGSGQSLSMQVRDFWKFADDCKLTSRPGITQSVISAALPVPSVAQDRGSAATQASSSHFITKKQFVEVLVRMACNMASVQGRMMERGAVTAALVTLIEQQIMPRAMVSARLEFKKQAGDVRVQEVLNNPVVNKAIGRAFRTYATVNNDNFGASPGRLLMTREKFIQMLFDLQLIDRQSGMRKRDIISIFSEVQDEDGASPQQGALVPSGSNPTLAASPGASPLTPVTDDTELMSIAEFTESLVAVAMFKFPHPMIALHSRVNQFFNTNFLPALRNHLGVKK